VNGNCWSTVEVFAGIVSQSPILSCSDAETRVRKIASSECGGFLFQRSSIILLGFPTTKVPAFSGRVPPRPEISIRRYPRSSLIGLRSIPPMLIAGYTERHPGYRPTIKQHLTAIKMLFDYLVVSQVVSTRPRHLLKDRTHVVKEGKTPILRAEDARKLFGFDSDRLAARTSRSSANLRDDDRPCRNPPYAQPDRR
jgi:hypothetical protein